LKIAVGSADFEPFGYVAFPLFLARLKFDDAGQGIKAFQRFTSTIYIVNIKDIERKA